MRHWTVAAPLSRRCRIGARDEGVAYYSVCHGVSAMDRLTVQDPVLIVLAAGDTPSAVNNARGHLFERFIAQLLHEYGYDASSESNLNITSEGIEIDLTATHSFSGHLAVVEAKAYNSNVRARVLTDFYGALGIYRFDHPEAHGYLFVTPRLVPEGEEQARKAATDDTKFHYLNSVAIVGRLRERGLLREPDLPDLLTSDPAVIVTEEGIYGALKIIDNDARTANSVVVWANRNRQVPRPVLSLLAEHDYALGPEAV